MTRRGLPAALLAGLLAAGAAPDFSRVDLLDGYAPLEVAPGDPDAHPLTLADPGDAALDPGEMARAQSYSDGLGGLALLVWQGGKLRYERYADGIGQDTRFETFSMHKSVLGLVYGAAIRDGVIGSVDDPAGRYLPEWAHDPRGAITLRDLLGMRSGLHIYARAEAGGVQLALGEEASKAALDAPADGAPGQRFEYNNANMQVAGHILNQALRRAGRGDYASYVSDVLLRPLGAGDAHLWLEHEGGDPRFFAHLQMRARDWLRVGIMVAGQGRFDGAPVLPAAWIKEVTTPSPLNPNYGLAIWLGSPWARYRAYSAANPVKMSHEAPYIAPDLVYFDGFGGERVYVSPSLDLVVVRIGQPSFSYDDSVIPNAVTRAAAPARQGPPEDADEALYRARFAAMTAGAGERYDPMEAVTGAANVQPLPLAASPRVAPEALAAATEYARANRSRAFLVWRDGALEQAAYFGGATAETPLVGRSLAKPLTAIAVGRAIALGRVASLDQPVSDFLTEWRGGPKAAITVRHLLDMRSGLLGQRATRDPDDVLNRAYLHPRHDDVLIRDYPLTHPPGTRFDYANAVADLVAIVIERATGQRYADFVSAQVLAPIGAAGGSVWVDRPGGTAHSGCCILLPAETWLRLAILLIDDGRWNGAALLPDGYVDEMRRASPANPYYGLGVYVAAPFAERRGFGNPDAPGPRVLQGEPYLARDLFLFDGNADQVVYVVPSERLIVLRMGDPPPASPEWDNAVLPNTILRGLASRADGARQQPRP